MYKWNSSYFVIFVIVVNSVILGFVYFDLFVSVLLIRSIDTGWLLADRHNHHAVRRVWLLQSQSLLEPQLVFPSMGRRTLLNHFRWSLWSLA